MTKRVAQIDSGEELAAKFAGWLVKQFQDKNWEPPQWFETSEIRGFDQETKKHYYFPGYSKEQELYQAAYTTALELWKENPNQKHSWYYITAKGKFFDDFYRPTLEYDSQNDNYSTRVPLDESREKERHKAIFGKHFALQPSADQDEPKAEPEARPHPLAWLDTNKTTCTPNCDGACNYLIKSEQPTHNLLSRTNKCSFCDTIKPNLRHVRQDKVHKSSLSIHGDGGIVNSFSAYKIYCEDREFIWKLVCEDCYIDKVLSVSGGYQYTVYESPPAKENNYVNPYCKSYCSYTPEQCEDIRNYWKDIFRKYLKTKQIRFRKYDKTLDELLKTKKPLRYLVWVSWKSS